MIGSSGIDLLNISQGVPASRGVITPPAAIPPAFYAASACKLKEAVDVPIAVVGRISDPAIAEELLASEATDFVGMGRSSLADPQFPLKVAQGRPEDIIPCIACLRGCAGESRRGHAVHCALNPRTGREAEYAECFDLGAGELPEAKSVMVVGGGIAGMEVALVAAARGHDVDLYEAGDKLGGQWRLAAVPPGKQLLASFASWQVRQIVKAGVRVHLNEKVTADAVVAAAPDVVVVATGSAPSIPPIPGLAESPLAVGSWDVLAGAAAVRGKVAVLGGAARSAWRPPSSLRSRGLGSLSSRLHPRLPPMRSRFRAAGCLPTSMNWVFRFEPTLRWSRCPTRASTPSTAASPRSSPGSIRS